MSRYQLIAVSVVVSLSCPYCLAGNALRFDGVNDLAFVPPSSELSLNTFSIEAWVQVDDPSASGTVLHKGQSGFGNYLLVMASNPTRANFAYDAADTGRGFGGAALPEGWNHIAVTYDSTSLRLFSNGILNYTFPAAQPPLTNDSALRFGAWGGFTSYFKGMMDEVRIWNTARTPVEIQQNYNRTVADTSQGLVGYWKFDESSGQTILDSSSYGNHGTLGANTSSNIDDPLRVVSSVPLLSGPQTVVVLNWDDPAPVQIGERPWYSPWREIIDQDSPLSSKSGNSTFEQVVLDEVEAIYRDAGVENIVFKTTPTAGAEEITVFFGDVSPAGLGGTAYSLIEDNSGLPDRKNKQRGGEAIVYTTITNDEGSTFDLSANHVARIAAHEIGHLLGLIHVDSGGSNDNLMESQQNFTANEDRFTEAVTIAEDSILATAGFTHNPVYHLKRYVDGLSPAALEDGFYEPGTWDTVNVLPFFTISVNLVENIQLYNVQILAGTSAGSEGGGVLSEVVSFDSISSADLAALEFNVPLGTSYHVVASSIPGGETDIALTMNDLSLENLELFPTEGETTANLVMRTDNAPEGFTVISEASVTGIAVPEPSGFILAGVYGIVSVVLGYRTRRRTAPPLKEFCF